MINYIIYHSDSVKEIITRKISYNCDGYDAVWTGATAGEGVIVYDPNTQIISFNKLKGTNPYWWQLLAAAICVVPPEDYTRARNRPAPFNVNIREGMSGCIHAYLNTYYKNAIGKYVLDGKPITMDISAGEKVRDGISIRFGDLIEIGRKLSEYFDMPCPRNPRWWKKGCQGIWRFEKLRDFEVVDRVDYDPDDNK